MTDPSKRPSRRDLLTAAAFGAAALGSGISILGCKSTPKDAAASQGQATSAQRKTLRIAQWTHAVPAFDSWFNEQYIKDWGDKNNTDVIVDNLAIGALAGAAAAEVASHKGHDLFGFLGPMPAYEDDVVDHADIYQECWRRYGKAIDLAIKATQNPRTGKYFAFADSFAPLPLHYRKDLFDAVGGAPDAWDDIRRFGKKIRDKTAIPVGIGLSPEVDTASALRGVLYSFGASEQDADGNVALDSSQTLEAVNFVKALYQEAMTPDALSWSASSIARAVIDGKASAAPTGISVTRATENQGLPLPGNISLARTARGPARRIGPAQMMNCYCIWKFGANIEGAKAFLVDYVGNLREVFMHSAFYNLPCFPTVPDLAAIAKADVLGKPADKYAVLGDAREWTANAGYPGYTNAAIQDADTARALITMFAQASTGAVSPKDAIREATKKCEAIWAKWKDRKLL